jgi:hypothetical protein
MRAAVLLAIYDALDEVNEQLPASRRVPRDPAVKLTGDGGVLDSLALVNLIVAAEQKIADRTGRAVILTDDAALFEPEGPISTVQRFVDHVVRQVEQVQHD